MMSNEKLMILQLVEEGKISVDEAVKLIEAVKANRDYADRQRIFDSVEFEEKMNRFTGAAESFMRDVSGKVNETWKGVEPKVKSAAKTAIEKTVTAIDKVSAALSESLKTLEEAEAAAEAPVGNGEPPEKTEEPVQEDGE